MSHACTSFLSHTHSFGICTHTYTVARASVTHARTHDATDAATANAPVETRFFFLFCLCWVLLSVILLYFSSSLIKRILYLCTPGICKTTETSSIRHLFRLGGWVGGSPPILSLFGFSEMSDNCRSPLTHQQFTAAFAIPAKACTSPGPDTTKHTAGLEKCNGKNNGTLKLWKIP